MPHYIYSDSLLTAVHRAMWTLLLLALDIEGRRGNACERDEVLMSILQKRRLTNEFESVRSLVSNFIQRHVVRVYASPLVTDCRLAQSVTPETVYSPTLARRLSKPINLIICLARAGFEPTTYSTAVQCHTTRLDQPGKPKWSPRELR